MFAFTVDSYARSSYEACEGRRNVPISMLLLDSTLTDPPVGVGGSLEGSEEVGPYISPVLETAF